MMVKELKASQAEIKAIQVSQDSKLEEMIANQDCKLEEIKANQISQDQFEVKLEGMKSKPSLMALKTNLRIKNWKKLASVISN